MNTPTPNPPGSALNAAREIPHETVDRARKTLRDMSLIPSYGESTCRLLGGIADGLDKAAFQMQVDDELGDPRTRRQLAEELKIREDQVAKMSIERQSMSSRIYELSQVELPACRREIAELREMELAADQQMKDSDWANQYHDACIKISEMNDEIEAQRAIIAKHSQPYAGAGESELRDALEKARGYVFSYVTELEEYESKEDVEAHDCSITLRLIDRALTPRVASTGSL